MSSDLIRLEYKVDLIISALQEAGLMHKELPDLRGIEYDLCALCKSPVKLSVDPVEGKLIRTCGCALPKKAFKLNLTTEEASNANNRDQEDTIPPDDAQ